MTASVEEILIGRVLTDPSIIPTLSLDRADFEDGERGNIWATMQRLQAAGRAIDLATLRAEGVDPGDPTRVLSSLHTAPVTEYVTIIKRQAFKRNTTAALETLGRAIDRHTDPADIMNDIEQAIGDIIARKPGGSQWQSITDVSMDGFSTGGLPYGLTRLDTCIQAAQAGNMIVVAARANVGKTAIALSISEGWARVTKYPVLFVSLEMSQQEIRKRFDKHISEADRHLYQNLIVDDKVRTVSEVRSALAQLRLRYGGIGGFVVDYLQRMGGKGDIVHERVAAISGELKNLSREYECPSLVLSQLNRQSDIQRRKPQLADLAQSGAIEQDADVVLALWRENKDSDYMEVIALKNRHGSAGWTVRLDFDLESMAVRGD